MSEFTETLYINADDAQVGIDWLRQVNRAGYVFEPKNGWVQVLPRAGSIYDLREDELGSAGGLMVAYAFAADHLWEFRLYDEGERLFRYKCAWECQNSYKHEGEAFERAAERLGMAPERLEEILYTGESDAEYSDLIDSAALFCGGVGLPNYSWVSFRYVEDTAEREEVDAVYVDDAGEVIDPNEARQAAGADAARLARDRSAEAANLASTLARAFVVESVERQLLSLKDDDDANALAESLADAIMSEHLETPRRLAERWRDELVESELVDELYGTDDELAGVLQAILSAMRGA